ncbi:hypothetical protein ONW92_004085 [Salmonella enterica]|nr:hypothetical protein [Salmonella enterica]
MEKSVFYREVAHRTECLQISVPRMTVAQWCDSPEHQEVLWQICRDTAPFMVPPEEGEDPAWRKALWTLLSVEYPDVLTQFLTLSGAPVLRNQLARGEVYAGAVLHSLLKSWLSQYSRGEDRACQTTQVMTPAGNAGEAG